MKKYGIVITARAEKDLRDIFEYIAYDLLSPEYAIGQLDRLEKAILKLDTFPERNALYASGDWEKRNLRIMSVDRYCVFYIPDREKMTVTIIRIIYSGRDIDAQLREDTESDNES
ncbi:MAG: type II toxin-antitoxin system RelE/ParE family toxin [Lachnospiraceae bacterium]|nr:type II toxin-antitoxin system RelE/ParE family toxin [Lachnospiraceae bacterium]